MNERYRFRALVLAMVGMWLLAILLDLASPNPSIRFPGPETGWEATAIWYAALIAQVSIFGAMVAGLYFFRWWARLLALAVAVVVTISAGFTAGYASAGLAEIPYIASGYLYGAILGVAYLASSISEAFRRK